MSLLAQRFREEVSKSKDYKMKVETEFPVGYPTGNLVFDFKNGTVIHAKRDKQEYKYYSIGIMDGSMNMFIGRSGCGKTTFVIQSAGAIVKPFKTSCVFHDDIEGGILENRKEMLTGLKGSALREKYISRNTGITAENFFERVKMISDLKLNNRSEYEYDTGLYDNLGNRIYKLEPTVYILDSLSLLMPEKYTEEEKLSGQMSTTAAAKANAMIFRRIIPLLKSSNIILFVINHILEDVSINPMQHKKAALAYLKQGETLPGGKVPGYLSNNMFRFDDTKLKPDEAFGIDGSLVDVTYVKSRSNKAGQVARLVFNQETGFDTELSLLVMLKQEKLINGAGAFLYIGEHSEKKFSQKKFKEKLHTDEEFRNIFMNACIQVLTQRLDEIDCYDQEEEVSITDLMLQQLQNHQAA